jgi:hypothetical protein
MLTRVSTTTSLKRSRKLRLLLRLLHRLAKLRSSLLLIALMAIPRNTEVMHLRKNAPPGAISSVRTHLLVRISLRALGSTRLRHGAD